MTPSLSVTDLQYKIIVSVLGALGLISLIAGLNNAWLNFVDFQQPAACLFISGENPFAYHINVVADGGHSGPWMAPPYLHHLYVLMAPLCLFDDQTARLIWAILNTVLAIYCAIAVCRISGRPKYTIVVLLFFLMSLPFRNGIGNSQYQVLILTFFIMSVRVRHPAMVGLFGAFSFIKYSFAGSWVGLAAARDIRSVIWSGLITGIFVFGGALWISSGDIVMDIFGPAIVASRYAARGNGDFFALFDYFVGRDHDYRSIFAVFMIIANVIVVYLLARRSKDVLYQLSIACTASLIFLKHANYDDVFLLPALVYLLICGGWHSVLGLFLISWFWQILKFFDIIGNKLSGLEWTVFHLTAYLVILASVAMSAHRPKTPILNFLETAKSND